MAKYPTGQNHGQIMAKPTWIPRPNRVPTDPIRDQLDDYSYQEPWLFITDLEGQLPPHWTERMITLGSKDPGDHILEHAEALWQHQNHPHRFCLKRPVRTGVYRSFKYLVSRPLFSEFGSRRRFSLDWQLLRL